jgi:hypothetical protein
MTHDLLEPLESGFAEEPPHLPVAERLAAGRRAVRLRRRIATTTALVGLAAVAIVPVLLRPTDGAGGGIDPPTPVPSPSFTPAPTPVHLLVAPPKYVSPDTPPVLYLYGRMFKRDRDVTVLGTFGEIDVSQAHPEGAAIVKVGGRTEWVAVVGNEPERLVAEKQDNDNYQLFMGWAQLEFPQLSGHLALAATAPGPYAPPVSDADSPAAFADHVLAAKPGGTVVQRIRQPLANAQSVPPCHAQAVRIQRPDQDWFVVGFDCRGLSGLYSEPVGVRAETLTTWLAKVKRVQDEFSG